MLCMSANKSTTHVDPRRCVNESIERVERVGCNSCVCRNGAYDRTRDTILRRDGPCLCEVVWSWLKYDAVKVDINESLTANRRETHPLKGSPF